jgi:hypothetical protein
MGIFVSSLAHNNHRREMTMKRRKTSITKQKAVLGLKRIFHGYGSAIIISLAIVGAWKVFGTKTTDDKVLFAFVAIILFGYGCLDAKDKAKKQRSGI